MHVCPCCRVAASPPLLWSQGMNTCLSFGLTCLSTYTHESNDTVGCLEYAFTRNCFSNTLLHSPTSQQRHSELVAHVHYILHTEDHCTPRASSGSGVSWRFACCQGICLLVLLLQVWYLAGTLVLVNAIACVVVVLVAALIAPTHATEEVRPCRHVLLC